jgi:hypothetical protein
MNAASCAITTLALTCLAGTALAQESTYVSGLLHTATGGAQLGPVDPVDARRLPVRNLGSSGQDGVEIQLNSMYGGTAGIDLYGFLAAAGREIKIKHRGWDGLVYGTHRMINGGGGQVTDIYDFTGLNAATITVERRDANGHTISVTTYPGPIVEMPYVPDWYCADGSTPVYWSGMVVLCNSCAPVWASGWSCPNTGGVFSFNSMRTIVTPNTPGGPGLPPIGAMEITASGMTGFDVLDASLDTYGVRVYGVGQAQISEECTPDAATGVCDPTVRRLPVRNLGSSGQDGVAIDLGDNAGGVEIESAKAGCCRGHVTLMKVYDDGGQEQRISRNLLDIDPTGVTTEELDADFSVLGGHGFVLTCFGPDGSVLGPDTGTSIIDGGPRPVWTNRCPPGSREIWNNQGTTSNPVWVFQGCLGMSDRIALPGAVLEGVASFQITPMGATHQGRLRHVVITKNGSELELKRVSVIPPIPHCGSADFNGDGDLGTDADIEAFFACLAGSCCSTCGSADFNGDGDLGTDADIQSFFSVLAGGPC